MRHHGRRRQTFERELRRSPVSAIILIATVLSGRFGLERVKFMGEPAEAPISVSADAEAEFIRVCLEISGLENRLAIARNRAETLRIRSRSAGNMKAGVQSNGPSPTRCAHKPCDAFRSWRLTLMAPSVSAVNGSCPAANAGCRTPRETRKRMVLD